MQGQIPRKLDNQLFEDSPDLNQRTFGPQYSKDNYPRFQDTQAQYQNQPHHAATQQNFKRQQQFHTPLTNNYMVTQPQFHQPPISSFQNTTAPRMSQSEESGGVIGTQEGRGESDEFEEDDEFEERQNMKDDENDIEYIIMNLYSKMKNLESKYIDLANYYKHELVTKTNTSRGGGVQTDENEDLHSQFQQPKGSYQGQTPMGRHSIEVDQSVRSQHLKLIQPGKDSSGGKRQGDGVGSERQIINDLIEEKKRVTVAYHNLLQLEEDMKQMIALRSSTIVSSTHQHQQSPPKVKEFKTNIPTQQQLKFLNEQLKDALSDVFEEVDSAQKKHLMVYLSQKQNEMYQVSAKYNFPAQAKNESLGLWYDAKTKTAQVMTDLKGFLQEKQKQIKNNLISSQINSERPETKVNSIQSHEPENLQQQLEQLSKNQNSSTSKLLDDFRKEISSLKKKQEQHQKQAAKLKQQLKFKDGLIKDETQRLGQLIREIKQGLASEKALLMSGEKQSTGNIGLMSPFEKKIATYQRSAEMRKVNNERSGSRGRGPMSNTGTNFYPSQFRNEHLNNPQILNQPQSSLDEGENRQVKQKIKLLEAHLDELGNKHLLKNQDIQDLEHLLDGCCLDEARHIQTIENLLTYHAQSTKLQEQKQRSRSRLGHEPFNPSPAGNMIQGKEQEKRLNDLQRNYDQIYQDLRKANEKYLNQKVENNKLKDEIQILQNALEDSQGQMRRMQKSQDVSGENRKIQPKSRINRHDPMNRGDSQPQRTASNGSTQLSRENDDLKKRVQELEKECYALTYYQQELQRRSNNSQGYDPYVRGLQHENQDLKNKLDQLCIQVQKFMLSMRRLQRAVNNKDKDIQNLKADFERNKKILDQMVKEIKEREDQQKQSHNNSLGKSAGYIPSNNISVFSGGAQNQHHSMLVGGSNPNRTEGSQERPRGRSAMGHLSASNRQQYPQSQREDLNTSNSQLPPKRGVIRPKTQQPVDQVEHQQEQPNASFQEQDRFNILLEEVKSINEERERMKKQIDDLQNQNEALTNEINGLEAKLNSKNQSSQRLNQQIQSSNDRIYKLEGLLNDYKDAIYSIEITQHTDQQAIRKLKNDLVNKEKDLSSDHKDKHQQSVGFGRQSLHVQTEGSLVDHNQLKSQLVNAIQEQERKMLNAIEQLEQRLGEKEVDLNGVKKLLVNKLKEIESSFVELSQDMIEHEQVQQEASKKIQQKQATSQSKANSQLQHQKDLEKSLGQIVADGADQKQVEELEAQIEELSQHNDTLSQENTHLKQMMKQLQKDMQNQEELLIIKANYEEIQEINGQLEEKVKDLQTEISIGKKQALQLKNAADKYKNEVTEVQKQKEKQANLHLQQLQELEDQLLTKSQQLSQEQEQRIIFQSEHAQKERQLKQAKSERQQMEQECEKMGEVIEGLEGEISRLQEELDLIKKLRQEPSETTEPQSETSEEVELQKINENPKEQAVTYLKQLKATQKELGIVKNQFEKLQLNYDELKQKFDQLKQESRTNVEEIMTMETKLFELEAENEKLKSQSTQNQDEQKLSKEQEEVYKQKLSFKEQEIEDLSNKMGRIVQNSIDLTNKCSRLEQANSELSTECELNRNKLQSLELELEMTKDNNERDVEQLQSQKQDLSQSLQESQSRVSFLEFQLSQLKSESQLEKLKLQQEIDKLVQSHQEQTKDQSEQDQALERLRKQVESQEQDLKNKDKQQRLVACLQLHVQRTLQNELTQAQEESRRKQRERRLIEVLQLKARESIIQSLEQEKQQRLLEQQEAQRQAELLKAQKEKELAALKQRSEQELEQLRDRLGSEVEEEQRRTREEYDTKLKNQKEEQEARRKQQQVELERLRKEQEELVKSLTEKQDKQTQDLIAQKERENQQLASEIQRIQEDLTNRHQKELEDKDKQAKMLAAMQEKLRKDLESKLDAAVKEREQLTQQSQTELLALQQERDQQVKQLEGKSKEQQDQLKLKIEQKDKAIQDHQQSLLKAKEEHDRLVESINKKRTEELKKFQTDLDTLRDQNKELDQQVKHLEEVVDSKDQENKRLAKDHQKVLKEEGVKAKKQLDEQNQLHEEKIKQLEAQLRSDADSYENQLRNLQTQIQDLTMKSTQSIKQKDFEIEKLKTDHQLLLSQIETSQNEQLQQLKQKLENDHQQAIQKKDSERSLVEKLQEKVREDLQKQIDLKDQEHKENQKRIKEIEQDKIRLEKEAERERREQMETLAELNQRVETLTEEKERQTTELDELKKELQTLKRQQHESANQQVRELAEQIEKLQTEVLQLAGEKKKADTEIESLTKQLKKKEDENQNLENDLTEAYSTMDEERNQNKEDITKVKQDLARLQEELVQAQSKMIKDKKDFEMQLKLKDNQVLQQNEDIEEYLRQIEEKKAELQQEQTRVQKQKAKVIELQTQIQNIKLENQEEMDQMTQEIQMLKQEIEQMRRKYEQNAALESDRSMESTNKFVEMHKKLQDANAKLMEQIEKCHIIEMENEQLKRQITEQEYSFARGNGMGGVEAKPDNFGELNASSIEQKDGDDDFNTVDPATYKDDVKRLETELEEFHRIHVALENQNKSLKTELQQLRNATQNASSQQQEAQEALENIKHLKSLFIKFLEKIPIAAPGQGGEELLPVLFSMMNVTEAEKKALQQVRVSLTEKNVTDAMKKGVLGGIFGKKKQ